MLNSQAQGTRIQTDPYRTLQLHPHAPQELIVEAYWKLVARARQERSPSAAYARFQALNEAYAMLMDDGRRREYDDRYGDPTKRPVIEVRRTLLGRRIAPRLRQGDYYRLLCADFEADSEIIQTAFAIMTQRMTGSRPKDVVMRQMLREARTTLLDSTLRARYDAELRRSMNGHARPSPAAAPSAPAVVAESGNGDARESTLEAGASASAPKLGDDSTAVVAPPPPTPTVPPLRAEQPVEPVERVPDARRMPAPRPALEVEAAVDTSVDDRSATKTPVVKVAYAQKAGALWAGLIARVRALGSAVSVKAPDARVAPPTRSATRRQTMELQRAAISEAERDRLLGLRELSEPAREQAPADRDDGPGAQEEAASAELVFVAGPQTGSRFGITGDVVMLGSRADMDVPLPLGGTQVAPVHASIWQHGSQFVFRQLDGAATVVNGDPLTLPLVLLEDGDAIRIGPHEMRFTRLGA